MDNKPVTDIELLAAQKAQDLLKCLREKEPTVLDKYEYYNADNDIRDFGISIPKKMIGTRPGIGWASRAVNTLSDRVVFDGFANDTFGVNELLEEINGLVAIGKSKHDAFIGGCAFVGISDDVETGGKVLVPFTAMEATGVINQKTGLLKYGLAVTRWAYPRDKRFKRVMGPADYTLFYPNFTAVFIERQLVSIIDNPTGRCLLQPITHRHSADRPFGKSRLTNTARRIIQEVGRLKRREEIAEEFYSTPQRYINGLAEGAKKDSGLDSSIGKVWAITKDDDGEKPEIGQLTQMSIKEFTEAKKDKARDFCAETALTLRNLGYETGNPSSSESLEAMSDDLRLEAVNSQTEMGEQIKQICITLRMAIDGINTVPDGLKAMVPAWKPIFRVDIAGAGDAMFKLFEVMPELQGTVTGYRMLGISVREAEQLAAKRAAAANTGFMGGGQ